MYVKIRKCELRGKRFHERRAILIFAPLHSLTKTNSPKETQWLGKIGRMIIAKTPAHSFDSPL